MKKTAKRQKRPPAAAPARQNRKSAMRARSGVQRRPEPAAGSAGYPIGKGRRALKGISIYMHPLAKEVLDKIALEQDRTVQDLGLEALNLLFRHYGEKPIA
jgi:hypothetical protein